MLCPYYGYGNGNGNGHTVVKPYPVKRVSDNVELRVTDQNLDECPRVFPLEESLIARTLLGTLGSHPLVIPRAGYRHREDVDKERKIEDFQGYSFISPHRLYYNVLLLHNSRHSVTTLMKTSPPTVQIPDIPDPLFFA
ncbi:hypothetical protein PIB30_020916 [Stylosanthes scabra]|uniref:Uncharacterized protein n=1 Tax=Stylosanthes scabra TaxID=79078 RepID=A0ABU6Y8Z0_9FABA|nr:hypothetical protein [Stylosanthes scabra]